MISKIDSVQKKFSKCTKNILMALCKTVITPLLTHWSYHSLALSHIDVKSLQYFLNHPHICHMYGRKFSTLCHTLTTPLGTWLQLCPCILMNCISLELIKKYFNDLVQGCCNSSALAMELLQSCTKPSIWKFLDSFAPWGAHIMYGKYQCPLSHTMCHNLGHHCVGRTWPMWYTQTVDSFTVL